MKVGLILPMSDDDGTGTPPWPVIRALARQAEAGGADSVWVYDHLIFRLDGQTTGVHEAWTLLSALAAVTESVELGTIVLATSFRNPTLLAKMATTLDAVSGGRLILGLGCGWHEPEYTAFGYPFDHRVDRFAEALAVLAPLLREGAVTFAGTYYQALDCVILPRGPRPRIPLLVAAKGPRMLRLTADHADCWNTAWFGMPDERLAQRLADMRAACAEAGRDPASLEVTVGIVAKADAGEEAGRPGAQPALLAEVDAIADALRAYEALGVGHVQLDVQPATAATFDVVLAGIARFRE